jgi:hypothetical protein
MNPVRRHPLRLAALALALLGACAPIRYASQEVILRHDAPADTLDVLILYDGVQAEPQDRGEDGIEVARGFLERTAVEHRREFMIFDWPLHLDLEKIVRELSESGGDPEAPWSAWEREGAEHLARIRAVDSGLCTGEGGRIALYQHFRVEGASRFVAWVDRSLGLWIDESVAEGSFARETPLLDDATRAAWMDLAKSGGRWLRLVDGSLDVNLPMSSRDASRILAACFEEPGSDREGVRFFVGLAEPITRIELAEGRLHLAWEPVDGVVRMRFAGPPEYGETLSKELRSAKDFPAKLPSREDVLRRFGRR